jgi:hypothetical protein
MMNFNVQAFDVGDLKLFNPVLLPSIIV